MRLNDGYGSALIDVLVLQVLELDDAGPVRAELLEGSPFDPEQVGLCAAAGLGAVVLFVIDPGDTAAGFIDDFFGLVQGILVGALTAVTEADGCLLILGLGGLRVDFMLDQHLAVKDTVAEVDPDCLGFEVAVDRAAGGQLKGFLFGPVRRIIKPDNDLSDGFVGLVEFRSSQPYAEQRAQDKHKGIFSPQTHNRHSAGKKPGCQP